MSREEHPVSVLVGDIGGTKTILAVAQITQNGIDLEAERRFSSPRFPSLEALVATYRRETGRGAYGSAVFAVAGPVEDQRSHLTNLSWNLDGDRLRAALGLDAVRLLNDLEAIAWGIPALKEGDLALIHPGAEGAVGNACVIAAGTGLGEAGLYWDGQRHHPFPTEGGHADFAPESEWEIDLLRWLQARYGHVSWERLVSGQGIADLYRFLEERGMRGIPLPSGDRPAEIARAAAAGRCPLCRETMLCFAALYGREAGNLALKHLALGGLYLGGGIAPKNLPLIRSAAFLDALFNKGRMAALVRRIPVRVILQPRAPLIGAARFFTSWGGHR